jgi:HEAT repeat protein
MMNDSTPFSNVIEALLDHSRPFHTKYLHRFSDMEPEDFSSLKKIWSRVHIERKITLLEDLEELEEHETTVVFDELAKFALNDENASVRVSAIKILWESPDIKLIPRLIDLMENDPDRLVRAEAVSALGIYVYKGELEEIPSETYAHIGDKLLKILMDPNDSNIQRCALESLGFSMRQDVRYHIQKYFESNDIEWMKSALIAMGRSADTRWEKPIINMFNHPNADIRFEAIRAAGELELSSAREPLLNLLTQTNDLDDDTLAAVVTSLSHIGGDEVHEALEDLLERTHDDVMTDHIEESMEYLDFVDGLPELNLFDFESQDKDDFYLIEDLSEEMKDDET